MRRYLSSAVICPCRVKTAARCIVAHADYTTGAGKIYHPNKPANNDQNKSWSELWTGLHMFGLIPTVVVVWHVAQRALLVSNVYA